MQYYTDVDGILLVFDLSSRPSFEELSYWHNEVQRYVGSFFLASVPSLARAWESQQPQQEGGERKRVTCASRAFIDTKKNYWKGGGDKKKDW